MYLLDTNVCLDFAKARSERLRTRVRAQHGRAMSISAVTLAELRSGAGRPGADPEDEHRLDLFVSLLPVIPFDAGAAETYGRFGAQAQVRRISFDRFIAAQAITLGLVLVTNNERDFVGIPGLRVENWTA